MEYWKKDSIITILAMLLTGIFFMFAGYMIGSNKSKAECECKGQMEVTEEYQVYAKPSYGHYNLDGVGYLNTIKTDPAGYVICSGQKPEIEDYVMEKEEIKPNNKGEG